MPVKNIIPGQKVTKAKLQRAKELRREMTPATPSALSGTSPKYDKKKSDCGFKVHNVGFGGGWVGVGMMRS
jgi:hypothetical protein